MSVRTSAKPGLGFLGEWAIIHEHSYQLCILARMTCNSCQLKGHQLRTLAPHRAFGYAT